MAEYKSVIVSAGSGGFGGPLTLVPSEQKNSIQSESFSIPSILTIVFPFNSSNLASILFILSNLIIQSLSSPKKTLLIQVNNQTMAMSGLKKYEIFTSVLSAFSRSF